MIWQHDLNCLKISDYRYQTDECHQSRLQKILNGRGALKSFHKYLKCRPYDYTHQVRELAPLFGIQYESDAYLEPLNHVPPLVLSQCESLYKP